MATTKLVRDHAELWPESKRRFERAAGVLPGGNSRTQLYVAPFPMFLRSGSGAKVVLEDGTELDDFLLNYTANVTGYAHPEVLTSVQEVLERGVPFGMPTAFEADFATALRQRLPAMELVRFTNSGSEATLHAFRAARAFTGRSTIAKVEGAFHGTHDITDFNVGKLPDAPLQPYPQTEGMPPGLTDAIVLFPYNDLPGTLAALDARRDELATVVLEVWLNSAGVLPGDPEYLQGVGAWCKDNDVLLTIDEVAAFRTSYHGAYADHGLEPDLVCLGKIIGGGFAIGALGGREDVMAVFDPRRPDHIKHFGTFNSHPATMVAGMKTLELLSPEALARINALGERLIDGIRSIGADRGIALSATGYGSVGNIHNREMPPREPRESMPIINPAMTALFWALLERGYVVAPRGQFSIGLPTTDEQVDGLLEAIDDCVVEAFSSAEPQ